MVMTSASPSASGCETVFHCQDGHCIELCLLDMRRTAYTGSNGGQTGSRRAARSHRREAGNWIWTKRSCRRSAGPSSSSGSGNWYGPNHPLRRADRTGTLGGLDRYRRGLIELAPAIARLRQTQTSSGLPAEHELDAAGADTNAITI